MEKAQFAANSETSYFLVLVSYAISLHGALLVSRLRGQECEGFGISAYCKLILFR